MIVLCADTHLDERTWTARPSLSGDSLQAFTDVMDHAIQHSAEAVVCAGDMFDVRKPPSSVLRFFRQQMSRLQKSGIKFYYIQGQHDLSKPPWASAVSDWPILLDDFGVVTLPSGITISGFSWQPMEELLRRLEDQPSVDLLVCHQVWREFMGDHIKSESSFEVIPKVGAVFTGDFHSYRSVEVENVFGDKFSVLSPGSTNLRKITEDPEKYFMELSVSGGQMIFDRVTLNTRKIFSGQILNDVDLENVSREIQTFVQTSQHPELGKPIIYLVISRLVTDALRSILLNFNGQAHIFHKIVVPDADDDSVLISVEDVTIEDAEKSLSICLPMVLPKTDPHYLAIDGLLSAADFETELNRLRSEFLNGDR